MTPLDKLKALIAAKPFCGKQVDFARAINRSPAQVNQWLSGYRKFDLKGQQIIENELGIHGYFSGHSDIHPGNVVVLPERVDPITAQVIAMMDATDDTGRQIVLAAARVALNGYEPVIKQTRKSSQ